MKTIDSVCYGKGIEFVCMGNNARSVMAEVVAKAYVNRVGANIPIYSSGATVKEFFETGPMPHVVEVLKSMGIEGQPVELTYKFIEMEGKMRNEALKLEGCDPIENHKNRQTCPGDYVDLMLAVAGNEKKILLEKFPEAKVQTIAEYTNSSYEEMVPVSLQDWLTKVGPQQTYLKNLMRIMPLIMDKYMCANLINYF